ncbi:MAG: hypothetical protein AAFY81_10745 [Pseudomonadota bacterium]
MGHRLFVAAIIALGAVAFSPSVVERDGARSLSLSFTASALANADPDRRRDRRDDRRDWVEDEIEEERRETRQQARRVARRTTRRVDRRHDYYTSLPTGCSKVVMNGYPYWYCGGVYYLEQLDNDTTVYVIVNP